MIETATGLMTGFMRNIRTSKLQRKVEKRQIHKISVPDISLSSYSFSVKLSNVL
jgi:hypothetical protein